MKTVRQLLAAKGHAVETIGPDATVFEALQSMADHEVGALVVVEGDAVCGLISERDYARKVILKDKGSKATKVREIMSENMVTISPEQTVQACMVLMTDKRVRHLPVLEDERLVAIVSIGDVVKSLMEEQKLTIEQLESYISGRG